MKRLALIALLFLAACTKDKPDMYIDDGVLVVDVVKLYDAKPGDTVHVFLADLYTLAEKRGLIDLPDDIDADQCSGSGGCSGTCPNGVTLMIWGWNEQLCSCSFAGGVLRVQCIAWGCPTIEIRCPNSVE